MRKQKLKWFAFCGIVIIVIIFIYFFNNNYNTKKKAQENNIIIKEETIDLEGYDGKFTIFFLADSHISLWDERDPEEVAQKAKNRYESFRSLEGNGSDSVFSSMMGIVKEQDADLLILGGDILDSSMEASVEFLEKKLETLGIPYIYTLGNHDFEYGTQYYTPIAFTEYLPRLQKVSKSKNGCQIAEYDEFYILAIDDMNNRVSEEALASLKKLTQQEKPIILVSHVPFQPQGTDELLKKSIEVWGENNGNSRVLIGQNGVLPDETTKEFLNLLYSDSSNVKLILSGHIHFYHRDFLTENTLQVVTGPAYQNEILKITIQ